MNPSTVVKCTNLFTIQYIYNSYLNKNSYSVYFKIPKSIDPTQNFRIWIRNGIQEGPNPDPQHKLSPS
jgi:hypothetical protein